MRALQFKFGGLDVEIPADEVFTFYATFLAGIYNRLSILPGDVVFDGGANVGDFSLLAARLAGPEGVVIAVEPSPIAFEMLLRNIRRNHAANVVPVQAFLSSNRGTAQITNAGSYATTVLSDSSTVSTVARETIDSVMDHVKVDRFDMVKLDIEGSEYEALSTWRGLENVRELMVETHSTELAEVTTSLLKQCGFKVRKVDLPSIIGPSLLTISSHFSDFLHAEMTSDAFALMSAIRLLLGRNPVPAFESSSGVDLWHARRFKDPNS